jgi:hypothetical protein
MSLQMIAAAYNMVAVWTKLQKKQSQNLDKKFPSCSEQTSLVIREKKEGPLILGGNESPSLCNREQDSAV